MDEVFSNVCWETLETVCSNFVPAFMSAFYEHLAVVNETNFHIGQNCFLLTLCENINPNYKIHSSFIKKLFSNVIIKPNVQW